MDFDIQILWDFKAWPCGPNQPLRTSKTSKREGSVSSSCSRKRRCKAIQSCSNKVNQPGHFTPISRICVVVLVLFFIWLLLVLVLVVAVLVVGGCAGVFSLSRLDPKAPSTALNLTCHSLHSHCPSTRTCSRASRCLCKGACLGNLQTAVFKLAFWRNPWQSCLFSGLNPGR